jgi:hypothetical protein
MYSRCAYFRVPASAVFSEDFGRFEQEVEVLLFCCVRSRVSKLFTFSSFAGVIAAVLVLVPTNYCGVKSPHPIMPSPQQLPTSQFAAPQGLRSMLTFQLK